MKQVKNQTANYIIYFKEIVKRYTSLGTGRETLKKEILKNLHIAEKPIKNTNYVFVLIRKQQKI